MDFPEKNEIISPTVDIKNNEVDELLIYYYFKCCTCEVIFLTVIFSLVFFFPFIFFIYYCGKPYKHVVVINKKKGTLVVCDKGIIPCCELKSQIFNINDIKKFYIYETGLYGPIGNRHEIKFYIISLTEEKIYSFFLEFENDEKLNEILSPLRKYFNTEYIPLKKNGDNNGNNFCYEENEIENKNLNNNNFVFINEENIMIKPPINEEAALPIIT